MISVSDGLEAPLVPVAADVKVVIGRRRDGDDAHVAAKNLR